MKWWIISQESIDVIRNALEAAGKRVEDACAASGCLCDLSESPHWQFCTDAIHELDSGLNNTGEIPADFREVKQENQRD